jgi:DNA-binding NarL/FixJ family response regulator
MRKGHAVLPNAARKIRPYRNRREGLLTEQQTKLLKLLATGMSNGQIGAEMQLTSETIKIYLTRIYQKIHVGARHEATIWAWRNGIADLPPLTKVAPDCGDCPRLGMVKWMQEVIRQDLES